MNTYWVLLNMKMLNYNILMRMQVNKVLKEIPFKSIKK